MLILVTLGSIVAAEAAESQKQEQPNFLLITVDDMNCDSVGAFGCELADTTPHMDRLATESLRFNYAHVQVGNCMPSRNVLWSGRYPHNNGVEGFRQVKSASHPMLSDLMQQAGYFTAIRGKVAHSTPYQPYGWNLVLDQIDGKALHAKDPASYYISTRHGIAASRDAGKPFCLVINISDPHKPFYATGKGGQRADDPYVPSRVFTAEEVPVPGFLPDHPAVRTELAQYYSTVRRADDCVGEALKALEESGLEQQTVVMFLSDHGMPLPFAKTALYHHSTRTPWMVRWPGVTQAGTADDQHMISAVDMLPTLLDVAGIEHPTGLDGRSFLALIRGEDQDGRDMIFKEYNENAGGARQPMRSVQTRRYGYIFNPWSNGQRVVRTATQGTATYRTMQKLAAEDAQVAARLELFDHRVVEEFYDYENDPDALHNLIDDPKYQKEIDQLRATLEQWMERTGDHALAAFRNRADPEALEGYMAQQESQTEPRRARRRQSRNVEYRTRNIE